MCTQGYVKCNYTVEKKNNFAIFPNYSLEFRALGCDHTSLAGDITQQIGLFFWGVGGATAFT